MRDMQWGATSFKNDREGTSPGAGGRLQGARKLAIPNTFRDFVVRASKMAAQKHALTCTNRVIAPW